MTKKPLCILIIGGALRHDTPTKFDMGAAQPLWLTTSAMEMRRPELEMLIQERLKSGVFDDVDELLMRPPGALDEKRQPAVQPRESLADFLLNSPFTGAELNLYRRREYMRRSEP